MGRIERVITAAFGVILLGVGLFAFWQDHLTVPWRLGGGLVLGLFGGNCVLAAYRGKPSWLSRIGPLP